MWSHFGRAYSTCVFRQILDWNKEKILVKLIQIRMPSTRDPKVIVCAQFWLFIQNEIYQMHEIKWLETVEKRLKNVNISVLSDLWRLSAFNRVVKGSLFK